MSKESRMRHDIKINPYAYLAVLSGNKTFEIRFNDRGYQKGDEVVMRCFSKGHYDTDKKHIHATISYVSTFEQKEGWCVFGIKDVHQ